MSPHTEIACPEIVFPRGDAAKTAMSASRCGVMYSLIDVDWNMNCSRSLKLRPVFCTRRGVSYVPQGRGLFAGMSVAENMELGRLKRRNGAGVHWDDDKVFAFFPRIKQRWRSPADYLSGGEQQMVAVARALTGDTKVLLLDEPFEGLAPAVVGELFEAFHKLRSEIAIVIVDHHLDLALALSDRTVALERGEVTYIGPSPALSEDLDPRRKVLWL